MLFLSSIRPEPLLRAALLPRRVAAKRAYWKRHTYTSHLSPAALNHGAGRHRRKEGRKGWDEAEGAHSNFPCVESNHCGDVVANCTMCGVCVLRTIYLCTKYLLRVRIYPEDKVTYPKNDAE